MADSRQSDNLNGMAFSNLFYKFVFNVLEILASCSVTIHPIQKFKSISSVYIVDLTKTKWQCQL